MSRLREWVEALESGRYRQTHGRLRRTGITPAFCCLGVQCELFDSSQWSGERWGTSTSVPPDEVLTAFGIDRAEVEIYINMNDRQLASFERIAEEIRRLHPGEFA